MEWHPCRASQRILERHQAQDGLGNDEVAHDLKKQAKLDNSANKIKDFLANNKEKLGSRNPLFNASETYQTEQEKRRLKRSKGRARLFNNNDFCFDKKNSVCHCPAGQDRQVQFEINRKDKAISYTDKMRVKIDSSLGRRQYSKPVNG